ncbi:MAG: Glutathione import ATP-binding protein GsiA [Chlamydiae bacterium]|nr:Glutathione import ATP-binding protein GsiA [Chlamydiota bacterium]
MTKNSNGKSTILEIKNLSKIYPSSFSFFRKGKEASRAVENVSFSIHEDEIVGLVGESGSGKTTVGRAILRLIEPTEGEILFLGEDLRKFSSRKMRRIRPQIQMVFQDPLSSLNPRKTILENIGEPLLYHKRVKSKEALVEVVSGILQKVGIPISALYQYPHQFSGGQQQRISIGRAISLRPKLVVCDEAVSALDLSIQAQILNLLYQLKKSLGLAYLFISHDLAVVRHLCDRVLVMHEGKIVEEGETKALFAGPKHPYTQKLFSSIPRPPY